VEPPAAAAPSGAPPAQAAPPESPEEPVDVEGWGGPRLRQIAKTFQDKGAVSPETAMTADELGLSRLFVRLLKRRKGRAKIFIEVNGKYYLDQKALHESKED
jgi:hypothetical protein